MKKELGKHSFTFGKENGGEALVLTTDFYCYTDKDGKFEDEVITSQKLTLHSYCNAATFELIGIQLRPEALRQLANELESFSLQTKNRTK